MKKAMFSLLVVGFSLAGFAQKSASEVYFGNFTDQRKASDVYARLFRSENGGLLVLWKNTTPEKKSAIFEDYCYSEGFKQITFKMKTETAQGCSLKLKIVSRQGDIDSAAIELTPGTWHEVLLPLQSFKREKIANAGSRQVPLCSETRAIRFEIAGMAGAELRILFKDFVLTAETGRKQLFNPDAKSSPYGQSIKYQATVPIMPDDGAPRVFMSDGSTLYVTDRFKESLLKQAKTYPGNFGAHFNIGLFHAIKPVVEEFNRAGIKTTFETHATRGFSNYLTNQGCYLTRFDGFTMNNPNFWFDPNAKPDAWPWHSFDISRSEVAQCLETTVNMAADCGFAEFLLIDYIWPWKGRWGYGPSSVASYRRDLACSDDGLFLSDGHGNYTKNTFWDYLRHFTDVQFKPAQLGITSWNEYIPVTEAQAANGNDAAKRNLFLFTALYHYEFLKFAGKIGDLCHARGMKFVCGSNPEDIANANDGYLIARVRGIDKYGYEYFGSPAACRAWYHNMNWFQANAKRYGGSYYIIGEIQAGGHGASRYDAGTAYAFYYEASAAAKPSDYNNQYQETEQWSAPEKLNSYHFGRYANWTAGALAFLQSCAESKDIQPLKDVVTISSRNILEYQNGFSANQRQTNSLNAFLEEMHFDFTACGKEGLQDAAVNARVLIYTPSQSSPMHLRAVKQWLAEGSGKVLISHSMAPFELFDGRMLLKRGVSSVVWTPNGNYATNLVDAPNAEESFVTPLKHLRAQELSFNYEGKNLKSKRDIVLVAGSKTLLADDHGIPLVSTLADGSNRIVYINCAIPSNSDHDFSNAVIFHAMKFAGCAPVAQASRETAVHIYPLPGGVASVVLWDIPTLEAMKKDNYYFRKPLAKPANIELAVTPNHRYQCYDFFADKMFEVTTTASGILPFSQRSSCEILYYGTPDTPEWNKILSELKSTRAKFGKLLR